MDKDILRELQLKELEIVQEIKRICDKNNIDWMLSYGSALGAVRHEGFIPWDDDVDIFMTEKEYSKFARACDADLNTEKILLQTIESDKKYPFPWAKIRLNDTCAIEEKHKNIKIHWGIGVDIFRLYYAPKSSSKREQLQKIFRLYSRCYYASFENLVFSLNPIRFGKILTLKILRTSLFRKMFESIIRVYCKEADENIMWDESECKFLPARLFKNRSYRVFEGLELPCPGNPEEYCEMVYGDWKSYPPEEERYGHPGVIMDVNKSYMEYMR